MGNHFTSADLPSLRKPKKISLAKLRSLWMSSIKQQHLYQSMLLKAYDYKDTELLDTLNQCIENEKKNQSMLRHWVDNRLGD